MSCQSLKKKFVLLASLGFSLAQVSAEPQRYRIAGVNSYLVIEALRDDLVHFEMAYEASNLRQVTTPIPEIYTTPLIVDTAFPGATFFEAVGTTVLTATLRLEVTLSPGGSPEFIIAINDRTVHPEVPIVTLTARDLAQQWKGFDLESPQINSVLGLGEEFGDSGNASGDWIGRLRSSSDPYGNYLDVGVHGEVGNTQFPIMYALAEAGPSYGLFLDNLYKQEWDFTDSQPWEVRMWGDQIRWYILTGQDLKDLRQDYMTLVGHPLIPPKKMFGFWLSEFGYENWGEIDDELEDLRAAFFPIDGFVLDLYWFGGVNPPSHMGSLTWDTANFPNAGQRLQTYKETEGLGFMLIEESYVDQQLPEYLAVASNDCFAGQYDGGTPAILQCWWGTGGYLDWTCDACSDVWHDWKRQPLIDQGIIGHWTDLGEPLHYDPTACYCGFPELDKHAHPDVHNIYNFKWEESIYRGYVRNNVQQRPFTLSRSGAPGIQRFGAAMWSADIASRLASLATHFNVHLHMSLSGIDYFSSDTGGFHRDRCEGNENEMYTQWLANSVFLDVPVRPHTDNQNNAYETSPARVGHLESNLENIRLRYRLVPYLYSLAYRAYQYAEPVFPPLIYYFQDDTSLWENGHQIMIGPSLMIGIVAGHGEVARHVYLPSGDWVLFHSNEFFHSTGEEFSSIPEYRAGLFRIPLFAKAGAVVPMMGVDDQTMNVMGERLDNSARDDLILRIYPAETPSEFTLYEDDGETIGYQLGEVRATTIKQHRQGNQVTVVVEKPEGTYASELTLRHIIVELIVENATASWVSVNGALLPRRDYADALMWTADGWVDGGYNLVIAKSPLTSIQTEHVFKFELVEEAPQTSLFFLVPDGHTTINQYVYIVGSIPQLGSWNPDLAIRLSTSGDLGLYPQWMGVIDNLPANTVIEWKAIIKQPGGQVEQWEPGANNIVTTPASGYGGLCLGEFSSESPLRELQ